jgi:hypothetical protein
VLKCEELLNCLYGDVVANLYYVRHVLGRSLPLLSVAVEDVDGTDDSARRDSGMIGDSKYRAIFLQEAAELRERLDGIPVSSKLKSRVDESFDIWVAPDAGEISLMNARAFFCDELEDSILPEVLRQLDREKGVIPENLAHLAPLMCEFYKDHPDYEQNVFLMMRFKETEHFEEITRVVRGTLRRYGLHVLRADDKEYSEDLWANVCVYALGCKCGVAVFEEIDEREFNPNIALEPGFMMAQGKRCLLLKDKRMPKLPTDVMGKLYKTFDSYKIPQTIARQLRSWLVDIGVKQN